jgi:hypothetical protein
LRTGEPETIQIVGYQLGTIVDEINGRPRKGATVRYPLAGGKNQALLALIAKTNPVSLTELPEKSGRAKSNLSRTLKTMERYGIVYFEKGDGREVSPRVNYSGISLEMSFAYRYREGPNMRMKRQIRMPIAVIPSVRPSAHSSASGSRHPGVCRRYGWPALSFDRERVWDGGLNKTTGPCNTSVILIRSLRRKSWAILERILAAVQEVSTQGDVRSFAGRVGCVERALQSA